MRRGLILFGISILALVSCGGPDAEQELTLYRKSDLYVEKNNEVFAFPLSTFNRQGEGNVPYVSLKEFLPVAKFIDQGFRTEEPLLDYSSGNGLYTINYSNGAEGEPVTHPFVFDEKKADHHHQ